MDTFTVMLGLTVFAFAFLGEFKNVGSYLWIAALFAILFAFRMAEPGFYMASAGLIAVLIARTFSDDDVREDDED